MSSLEDTNTTTRNDRSETTAIVNDVSTDEIPSTPYPSLDPSVEEVVSRMIPADIEPESDTEVALYETVIGTPQTEADLVKGSVTWLVPHDNTRALRNLELSCVQAQHKGAPFKIFLRNEWQGILMHESNERKRQQERGREISRQKEIQEQRKAGELAKRDSDNVADQIASGRVLLTIEEYEKLKKQNPVALTPVQDTDTESHPQTYDSMGKGKPNVHWHGEVWDYPKGKGKGYGRVDYYPTKHYDKGSYKGKTGKGKNAYGPDYHQGKGDYGTHSGKGKGDYVPSYSQKGKSKGKGCTPRVTHVYQPY